MQFLSMLGKKLKSDDVIELLEHFDIDVVYDFDRLHEGMEDAYWASAHQQGFQFRFDEEQTLDVIFLYMAERHGFAPINEAEIEVPIYPSFVAAKESFEASGKEYTSSPSDDPSSELYQRWIKSMSDSHTVHYEFVDKRLRMITMSLVK
ncbi:hypothetical protein ACQUWM_15310 [Marinobacter sp. DUT-3]|uniref:hypothetical protein n=1 Tax=Marinobacter sp. DUT-3 TaxID=3412036 RepID=UPI003D17A60D